MNEITMENLPIIIEAIGESEQTEAAAEKISKMLGEHGLVQLQPTTVFSREPAEDERRDAHA
jgi:PII-like signaling protein